MTVSAQTPINRSTGNGVTTVFPYTFKVLQASDMRVTVGGVVKTLTTDYTLSGVGTDSGNVTILVAPASGAVVVLQRSMSYTRSIDYQDQGSLPAATLDDDQDSPVMMLQQLAADVDRTVKYPISDGSMLDIPAAADRANKLLSFDALGNPTATLPLADSSTSLRADLAASSGSSLVGFYAGGAGSVPTTVAAQLRRVSVNAANYGLVANAATLVSNASTTANLAALNAAMWALPNAGGTVIIPAGNYYIDAGFFPRCPNITIKGAGPAFTYTYNQNCPTKIYLVPTASEIGFNFSGADNFVVGYPVNGDYGGLRNLWVSGQGFVPYCLSFGGQKTFEDCTFSYATYSNALGDNAVNSTVFNRVGLNDGLQYGLLLRSGENSNTKSSFSKCNFNRNGQTGIRIENSWGGTEFDNCTLEGNSLRGLHIYSVSAGAVTNQRFDTCWFEGNGNGLNEQILISAIDSASLPIHTSFDNCTLTSSTATYGMVVSHGKWIDWHGGVNSHALGSEFKITTSIPSDVMWLNIDNCRNTSGTGAIQVTPVGGIGTKVSYAIDRSLQVDSAIYAWDDLNPSAVPASTTNSPATGTAVNDSALYEVANSGGTTTFTLPNIGYYELNIQLVTTHASAYTNSEPYFYVAGTASVIVGGVNVGEKWGDSGNHILNARYIVRAATVNATVTARFIWVLAGCSGVTSDHVIRGAAMVKHLGGQ